LSTEGHAAHIKTNVTSYDWFTKVLFYSVYRLKVWCIDAHISAMHRWNQPMNKTTQPYPHRPPGLHQSYTHHMQRQPTVTSCSPASSRYVGPHTAMSNTLLRSIQTDATFTSFLGPHTQTLTLGWVCSSKRLEPFAHRWKDFSNESTWLCLSEADAYYTHELLFYLSTATKSRPACYTWACIVCEILRYLLYFWRYVCLSVCMFLIVDQSGLNSRWTQILTQGVF